MERLSFVAWMRESLLGLRAMRALEPLSVVSMLSIALAAFLPRVEDPVPDTIGVGVIFSAAGTGGVVMLVLGSMVGLSDADLDLWARHGVSLGFAVGALFYAAALAGEVL